MPALGEREIFLGRTTDTSTTANPNHSVPIPILSSSRTGAPVSGRLVLDPEDVAPEPAFPDATPVPAESPLPEPSVETVVVVSLDVAVPCDPGVVVGVVVDEVVVGVVVEDDDVVVVDVVVEVDVDEGFAVHVYPAGSLLDGPKVTTEFQMSVIAEVPEFQHAMPTFQAEEPPPLKRRALALVEPSGGFHWNPTEFVCTCPVPTAVVWPP